MMINGFIMHYCDWQLFCNSQHPSVSLGHIYPSVSLINLYNYRKNTIALHGLPPV